MDLQRKRSQGCTGHMIMILMLALMLMSDLFSQDVNCYASAYTASENQA